MTLSSHYKSRLWGGSLRSRKTEAVSLYSSEHRCAIGLSSWVRLISTVRAGTWEFAVQSPEEAWPSLRPGVRERGLPPRFRRQRDNRSNRSCSSPPLPPPPGSILRHNLDLRIRDESHVCSIPWDIALLKVGPICGCFTQSVAYCEPYVLRLTMHAQGTS